MEKLKLFRRLGLLLLIQGVTQLQASQASSGNVETASSQYVVYCIRDMFSPGGMRYKLNTVSSSDNVVLRRVFLCEQDVREFMNKKNEHASNVYQYSRKTVSAPAASMPAQQESNPLLPQFMNNSSCVLPVQSFLCSEDFKKLVQDSQKS